MRDTPTIISTWPAKKEDRFATFLQEKGMTVVSFPMIEVNFRLFTIPGNIRDYDWVIFTSKNGARSFLEQYTFHPNNKIAVIGEGTAAPLRAYGMNPHFVGEGLTGEAFAEALADLIGEGHQILLALGDLAPDTLCQALSPHNIVERIDVYETRTPEIVDQECFNDIIVGNYDFIAVSSPSAIKNLYALVKDENKVPLRIASIGETTSRAAGDLGIEPVITADEPSYEGLAEAVLLSMKKGLT